MSLNKLIGKLLMFIAFHLCFKWLIKRNYWQRKASAINADGEYKDQWYWVDLMCVEYGYFTDIGHRNESK